MRENAYDGLTICNAGLLMHRWVEFINVGKVKRAKEQSRKTKM